MDADVDLPARGTSLVAGKDGSLDGLWRRLVMNKSSKIREQSRAAGEDPDERAHVTHLLDAAEAVAASRPSWRMWWTGEQCDHAWRLVHEAEAHAMGLLPEAARIARMREVQLDATTILNPHDPVLSLDPAHTNSAADSAELLRRYRQAWDDRYVRSRNYRNRLIILTGVVSVFLVVLLIAGAVGLIGMTTAGGEAGASMTLAWPAWDPSWSRLLELMVIGTIGSVGGLLAGARQILQVGGVYNPFYLPLHSLMVKIQMGALCAIVGVVAVLGGIASEIRAVAWGDIALLALLFGATQQLITQLIDRKVTGLVSSEPRDQNLKK